MKTPQMEKKPMSNTHRRCNPGSHPSRLSQAIQGLLLASALTASVAAHGEETTNRKSYHISGGSLGQALSQFARDAGILFTGESTLTDGKTSKGLDGEYTVEEGFRKLLAGSGLTYTITEDNAVAIKVAEPGSDAASTLPAVKVSGKAVYDANDPYNPDYNRTNASSATKTDTPIMETPVSIQVIPKAVMNDQQAVRVSDALRNVSGYFDTRGDEFFYDDAFLRGFNTSSRQYIDGMLDLGQSRSLANLERVEVVKGPSAALYGRLQPGGLINHVTKRPLDTPYYSVQQQFGSFDLYRTQVDATGPLTQDGALAYRLNMEYLDSNSYIDYVNKERAFVAPSLTWKISPSTKIDFDFRYHEVQGITNLGLPASGNRPANIPISRFSGEPSDHDNFTLYNGGVSLFHEFTEAWKLVAKFGFNHNVQQFDDTTIQSFNEITGDARRLYFHSQFTDESKQGMINITGNFDVLSTKHALSVGWDYYNRSGMGEGRLSFCQTCGTQTFPATLNIYNPVYNQSVINVALENPKPTFNEREEWYGFYIQDQMTFLDNWHLLYGARYDQANYTSSLASGLNLGGADDSEFSPRVGLLYRPIKELSIYGNYVKAFNGANTGLVVSESQREPEHSEEYEFGLKTEWFDNQLSANLAFYELTKSNVAQPHSNSLLATQGYRELVGEARSKGIEFDISGKLTDNWNLIGTYSLTDTEITKDRSGRQGNQFANVPKHAGSIWSRYEFTDFGWHGLWTGAGVFLAGQRQGDTANSFQLPGYARLDAALGYSFNIGKSKKMSLQFNVDNLLDKEYYTSGGSSGSRTGIRTGVPRTFLGSVRIEF
jgi:iron complex outermembrane recepter protein